MGAFFEKADRKVGFTVTSDEVHISTVFLGIDHSFGEGNPLLFERMVFGGKHDGYQDRYSTWEEAEEGHEKVVDMCNEVKSIILSGSGLNFVKN